MSEIRILDATCGSRSIWFQKNEPHTVYCDRRECTEELPYRLSRPNTQHLEVHPDIIADFKDLPFEDGEFNLVVFDPPHAVGLSESWIAKKYGTYPTREEMLAEVTAGFRECWRVLATGGVLIFKWAETSFTASEIIKAIGHTPLFGHKSGKKSGTHWMCFMRFDDE